MGRTDIARDLTEVDQASDWYFIMKELIHQYGAWIVFALVFLESIGLPLPGEAILVSASMLWVWFLAVAFIL